jgi:hypothetical protein
VPKCGLPPPIECTQRRCCVTDRSLGKCSSISILYYFGNVQIWSSRMAGLAWSAPVSCVALSMSWSARRAARGHAPGAGCLRHNSFLECYCACRRHQDCHCRETQTSVRLRFLGSSRTSRCLPVSDHMGCGAQSAMAGRELNAGHLLAWRIGVAQLAIGVAAVVRSASSSIEPLWPSRRSRRGDRPEDGRMFQIANWHDRPHMRRGSTNQCNPRRRQGGDPLCSRLP